MYSKKPILVSYNGYKTIINEAQCGEFIEANNPSALADKILEYYIKSPEELKKIGEAGRKYLEENLKYEILVKKYMVIINS